MPGIDSPEWTPGVLFSNANNETSGLFIFAFYYFKQNKQKKMIKLVSKIMASNLQFEILVDSDCNFDVKNFV